MGRGTQACLPSRVAVGRCSAGPGVWPQCQELAVQGSGWGKRENWGLVLTNSPSLFSLLLPFQPWPCPPFSPHSQSSHDHDHILPPDSSSWPSGLQAWRVAWGEGVWDQDPQNKYLPLCSSIAMLSSQKTPSQPHCFCFPFCLVDTLRGSLGLPPDLGTLGIFTFLKFSASKREGPAHAALILILT